MARANGERKSMNELWQTLLCDAHAHLGGANEQQEREQEQILSLLCASTPDEARELFSLDGAWRIPTCGIHPWHAHQYKLEMMLPWMMKCPIIGEIGMDSVWCSVPLTIQEEQFRLQLDLACRLKKPVILHTKGPERQIAEIIRDYPNQYLVHWYSCEHSLEYYLDLDCYFSVGPDVWWNPAVRHVAQTVPLTRILTETDGLNAVKWAEEEGLRTASSAVSAEVTAADAASPSHRPVTASLLKTLGVVAELRHMSLEEAKKQVRENLLSFLPSFL